MQLNNTGVQFFIDGERIPKKKLFKVVRSATMLKLVTNVDLKDQVHLASGNTKEQLATGKTEELANLQN